MIAGLLDRLAYALHRLADALGSDALDRAGNRVRGAAIRWWSR